MLRLRSLALVTIPLALLGALGSITGIASGYGPGGVIAAVVLTCLVAFGCLVLLRPMLTKNERGVTLLQAINASGLVDVENRIDSHNPVAPTAFMKSSKQEVVISGISLALTFRLHLEEIKGLLRNGILVRILMLHPDSATTIGDTDRRADVVGVIAVMVSSGLSDHPGFSVRFRKNLPSFTAIMVDGDVEPTGNEPRDKHGQIRVQPTTMHRPLQSGTAFRFKHSVGSHPSSFQLFATDLRNQWMIDGIPCPELLTK